MCARRAWEVAQIKMRIKGALSRMVPSRVATVYLELTCVRLDIHANLSCVITNM